MGREIRRVPKGWQHLKDEKRNYKPLYDHDYETAADDWVRRFLEWEGGSDERQTAEEDNIHYFWDWDGGPPDADYYREKFTDDPTCYQIYETVSEGTPVSPVFGTEEKMVEWLVDQGHSRKASEEFVKVGWVSSMLMIPGEGVWKGIDQFDRLKEIQGEKEP